MQAGVAGSPAVPILSETAGAHGDRFISNGLIITACTDG